ncbi:amino acid ABC transporter substrate-binding protein [Clostridium uliginosum]|uniref:Polar amino acid transport system substrate-binding protein n=1 Tax=Clostridium uliginosum TaxID=119641 RepID=A0A1I1N6P5_9CLOT|nr:amino acid ABC transporter substrate-binding protein [Clostridium uliginosum]SFC89410.1 polar amino acid transport system substrate-binding protein [Clostridium uliginosum]
MKINKLIKKILMISCVVMIGTSLVACQTSKTQGTSDKQELVMGFDDTFVPMGFKDENGKLVGFDVELAKAVGEKLNKTIKFQAIDWSMKESELKNGNIDLIWNGYSVTDERKKMVEFSNAYLNNRQVIVTLANSKISSKQDLAGAKVGAQNQSSAVDAIEADGDIIKTFDSGKIVTFETNNDALMDLEAGRIDAVVADEILAKYYIKERGKDKYKVLDDDFGKETYAVGIRKGDTKFVEEFNKALEAVVEDGSAGEISKKWFGEDIIVKADEKK